MTPAAQGTKISLRLATSTATYKRSADCVRIGRIVNGVLDTLLAAEAFDELSIESQGPQTKLTTGDVLMRTDIPDVVLDRVAAMLEASK